MRINGENLVYVVDDDVGHLRLIEKNLKRSGITSTIRTFSNGSDVLECLLSEGSDPEQPSIILLDLNMPGLSGQKVISQLKENPRTKHIPIVVVSTTDNPHEISECYALGTNLYMVKHVDYHKFMESIQKLGLLMQEFELPRAV